MTNNTVLHDEGWHAILEAKFARIISEISKMYNVSLDDAMDMFYNSETMQLMEEGLLTFIAEAKNTWQRRFGERNILDDYLCSIKT